MKVPVLLKSILLIGPLDVTKASLRNFKLHHDHDLPIQMACPRINTTAALPTVLSHNRPNPHQQHGIVIDHRMGLCEGDCDVDAHCAPGLICFQRNEHEAVPGCSGGKADDSKTDFCIDPLSLVLPLDCDSHLDDNGNLLPVLKSPPVLAPSTGWNSIPSSSSSNQKPSPNKSLSSVLSSFSLASASAGFCGLFQSSTVSRL